jgi:D-3-phosphoglycerate dehydrogenase
MLGMMDSLRHHFESRGVSVGCPKVVQTLSEAELVNLVPEFDGWIIGDDPATKLVFEAGRNGRLRAAVKWGIGIDNVDFAAAASLNIPISNTPNMFGREVADVAMAYVVMLARELHVIDRAVREGGWPKPRGISLADKTMGLIGFGDIGSNLASRALAAEMKVVVFDPAYVEKPGLSAVEPARWPDRIGECDFLVLTCSLNKGNHHIINAEILKQARDGVRIVNVARGPLIEEVSLIEALDNGTVHAAALDVFEEEPLPMSSPLRNHPACVFGSHNSSNTAEAVNATSIRAIKQLFEFLGLE